MFVKVNNRILDWEEYRRKLLLVKRYARHSLKETLEPYGFEEIDGYFYNEELDLYIWVESKTGEIEKA